MTSAFQHSASKGSARLVLLAMADEANDEGLLTAYRRSLSWLAHKANVDKGTAKRAVAMLVELGEVVVLAQGDGRASSDYRLVLPGLQTPSGDSEGRQPAPPRRTPRVSAPPTEGVQPDPPHHPGGTPVLPEPPAAGSEAHDVVRGFYDWCAANGKPKPTLPAGRQGNQFMALVHIVQAMLDAGWKVPQVKVALTTTPAYTTNAITLQLNQQQGQRPAGPGPRAPISDDRDGPSGRVDV